MPFDNSTLSLPEIEALEHKYLMKYWYFLKFCEDEIVSGIKSMEDIRADWDGKYGTGRGGTSEFDVGCERIIYALLNGKIAGRPNSSPVSSDLFFEVDDAYIHIDLKSVTTSEGTTDNDNINDFCEDIFIGRNQNSYNYDMEVRVKKSDCTPEMIAEFETEADRDKKTITVRRPYIPNLPHFYTKSNGDKKITLTYFVCLLNSTISSDTQMVSILCMPNGLLSEHYGTRPLKAGKTIDKIVLPDGTPAERYTARYKFKEVPNFELLDGTKKRVRIVHKNPNMSEYVRDKLSFYLANFDPQVDE